MKAYEVERALLRGRFNVHQDTIIPRCCLAGWEADLLIIRRSGWAEEVEIKVSYSDFKADFREKGEKHRTLSHGQRQQVYPYYAEDGKTVAGYKFAGKGGEDVTHDPTLHEGAPKGIPVPIYWYVRRPQIIRKFWFAMPEELAEKCLPEVPEAYGVLSVGRHVNALREATPLKSARKVTDAERIHALQSTYSRYWQHVRAEELKAQPEQPTRNPQEAVEWLISLNAA